MCMAGGAKGSSSEAQADAGAVIQSTLTPHTTTLNQKKRKRSHGDISTSRRSEQSTPSIPIHDPGPGDPITPGSEPRTLKRKCRRGLKKRRSRMEDVRYVTASGSTLTLQSAGHVLSRYLNSFGRNPAEFHQEVTYTVVPNPDPPQRKKPPKPNSQRRPDQPPPDSMFLCQLALPTPCPLRPMTSPGMGYRSKDAAKKRVTFEMVKTLISIGEVDENLQPKPRAAVRKESRKDTRYERIASKIESRLQSPVGGPAPEDGRSPIQRMKSFSDAVNAGLPPRKKPDNGMPGVSDYQHLSEAAFWSSCDPFTLDNAYVTSFILLVDPPFDGQNATYRTMCLLTTRPLPIFSDGPVKDMDVGMPKVGMEELRVDAKIRLRPCGKLTFASEARLDQAIKFTECLVRSHVHKDVHLDLARAKWLLLPNRQYSEQSPSAQDCLDVAWDEVKRGAGPICTPFSTDPEKLATEIDDVLATTHVEFSRRYAVKSIRTDLTPSTPLPGESDKTPLTDQLVAPPPLTSPEQPILEAELVYPCKAGGTVASFAFPKQTKYMIPELTAKHCISASVSRSTSNLPAFFVSLNNYMIAQQLTTELFQGIIHPDHALTAISAPTAHGLSPEKSYQRFEFLGDTLLKLVVVVYLLQSTPETGADWEKLHTERQIMGSNRTLHDKALSVGLPPYIRTARTRARDWAPSGWPLTRQPREKPPKADTQHSLGDKTIADVVEALVAAGYLSVPENQRLDRAIEIMSRMNLISPRFRSWNDLKRQAVPLANTPVSRPLAMPLRVVGHMFRDPRKGREALSMSADKAHKSAFQRLKSIGDAALDYFIVKDLYDSYPMALAGALSNMRHSRHGDSCLAAFCASSGLLDQLTEIPVDVLPGLSEYKRNILRAQRQVEQNTEPKKRWEFWKEVPPQHYLGDVVNALLGAILLDVSWDLEALRAVYQRTLVPFFERYCIDPSDHHWHPRGELNEMMAARGCHKWLLDDLGRKSNVDPFESTVTMHGRQIGIGLAETQLIAARKACDVAVRRLRSEKLLETLCDCPKKKKSKMESA